MNLLDMLAGANPIKSKEDANNSYSALLGTLKQKIGGQPVQQPQMQLPNGMTEEEFLALLAKIRAAQAGQ